MGDMKRGHWVCLLSVLATGCASRSMATDGLAVDAVDRGVKSDRLPDLAAPDGVRPDYYARPDGGTPRDVAKPDSTKFPLPGALWSKEFGSGGGYGYGVALDSSGNVYVTGEFEGTVDFGGGPLTSTGDFDIFIVSYSPTGSHRWSKRFGGAGPSRDVGWDVGVDKNGNVTVGGFFRGTVDFGGGPLTSPAGEDFFVASFDSMGGHRWSKNLGGFATAYGLAVDGNGNVTLTGYFAYSVDFGGGPLKSAGGNDIFVASYGPAGNHRWSKRFGSPGTWMDIGNRVAVDKVGNVTVTGIFAGVADFGGGPLVSAGGATDIFVASYDSMGAHRWSKGFGGYGGDSGWGVAVDSNGNVTVTGSFDTKVDFGGGPLTSNGGTRDIFVASFAPTGSHRWSKSLSGAGYDSGLGVAVDGSDNVIVTGSFEKTVDFGGGPLTSTGSEAVFVASYNAMGAYRWSKAFGGSNGFTMNTGTWSSTGTVMST